MESGTFIDTHVAVWLCNGELQQLSPTALKYIEELPLCISPISIMEIDLLHEIGRFKLSGKGLFDLMNRMSPLQLIDDPLSKLVEQSKNLHWTRDPFDRLIVAHAQLHQMPVITRDRKIREHYKKAIW